MMPQPGTSRDILRIAAEILASDGIAAVSFDAIARRLGRSKQAVLYWYPTKQDLLAALFLPWLESETEVAVRSVDGAADRRAAITGFVRAVAAFHLNDLDRFRAMYLLPQTIRPGDLDPRSVAVLDKVHPVTDRLYGALARHLPGAAAEARREAVAIHAAVLGLVVMFGLADSLDDPLKHDASDMVETLARSLSGP